MYCTIFKQRQKVYKFQNIVIIGSGKKGGGEYSERTDDAKQNAGTSRGSNRVFA